VHELEVHQLELEVQNRALQEAQVVLEESRARYAELYDYAPVAYLTLDREGVVRELNLAAAALLGKERREIVDRPLRLFISPGSRSTLDAHLRINLHGRRPASVELALSRADADAEIVELLTVPPPAHSSAAAEGVSIFHAALIARSRSGGDDSSGDQVSKVDREARLRDEGVNRIKQDFLAIVSHELRSPLAPMQLWVRALRASGASETLRRRATDALEMCLNLQTAMIEDLIDVARGQQGTLRVDRRPMDFAVAVRAAVEALAPSAAAKQITVAVEAGDGPTWVWGDATRLQQVVTNLLSNAIAFSREAGRIEVALRDDGERVVLAVRDEGEGIDPARLPHIFEPFHGRLQIAKPHQRGLGIGLAIVRQLVAGHDGDVKAESAGVGRGACFTVMLPRLAEPKRRPLGSHDLTSATD
jgi:PAS domain S-box-containing protein